ncbi:MAG: hypothetical protein Q4F27_04390 [Desulfovibrionaceae bacterium]|nr:hypothetical protein [Desulfovibrionaceae bacterium]
MITLEMPLPSWLGNEGDKENASPQDYRHMAQQAVREAPDTQAAASVPAGAAAVRPQSTPGTALRPAGEMPQGSAAARLAAATRPRPKVPPVTVAPPLAADALLAAEARTKPRADENLLDMLGLTRLPIPSLGSVQTAHAAAQDMPVPQAPAVGGSPFAPAEQMAPMGYPPSASAAVPGLPGSQPSIESGSHAPSLPRSRDIIASAPTPHITASAPPDNPNDKAQELARQQQDILMLRQQMDQRLKELEEAERKMKDMIREARDLEDRKVRNLIQMYANMKPRTAAKALESMDERVAVKIVSGMAPKQSGEILTYTNPAKTAKFTEYITRMRMPE